MSNFFDRLIGLAPAIGTAIGGPVGTAVGIGVRELAESITDKKSDDDIIATLQANPEKLAELAIKTKELELKELREHAKDRQSAREQTVELAKLQHPLAYGAAIVSCLVIGVFGLAILYIFRESIPEGNRDMAFYIVGQLSTMAGTVVAYWMGSSRGSSTKENILATIKRAK